MYINKMFGKGMSLRKETRVDIHSEIHADIDSPTWLFNRGPEFQEITLEEEERLMEFFND